MSLEIRFGTGGNAASHQLAGWAEPEQGFTWTLGGECHLLLPPLAERCDRLLELRVMPFVHGVSLESQRLAVFVNRLPAATCVVTRPAVLAIAVPGSAIRTGEPVRLAFSFPDANRPCDIFDSPETRTLAFAFTHLRWMPLPPALSPMRGRPELAKRGCVLPVAEVRDSNAQPTPSLVQEVARLTGKAPASLALEFESLGQNCEFGLFQRRCGAEPLGLFRFASIFANHLVRGLETNFAALGATESIEVALEGPPGRREFAVHDTGFELTYHTFVMEGQSTPERIRAQELRRLAFHRRKFADDLESGEKIFVRTMRPGLSNELEMLPIFLALNRDHPNTLLWVMQADREHPPGAVEHVAPRLLRAYIRNFAPGESAGDLCADDWLAVIANAYVIDQATRTLPGRDLIT